MHTGTHRSLLTTMLLRLSNFFLILSSTTNFYCILQFKEFCLVFVPRVLQLMNITDAKLSGGGSEKLDLAMLSFFEQFSKIYLGNQVQKSSKVMFN